MDTTKTITHLSLCSGYEGIGLGLRRVFPNLREIAYVEREGFPVANLVAKMEEGKLDAAPVFTDVKTFPYDQFFGQVDILSGGFPCQPFSAAGKRQATEDPRHLFPSIARGIKACKPRIVFLENVQGILSCKTADGEPVLQYVLRTLEEMDYRATAGIFSAEEVGAPHQRKRVFILGYSKSRKSRLKTEWQRGQSSSGTSSTELANSECGGLRGGRSSQERRDDSKWIQGNEGERNELRSEVEGCGDSSRGAKELGVSNSQPSGETTGAEQPAEGLAVSGAQGRSRDSREELGNARSSESHRVSDKEWTSFSKTGVTSEELGNAKHDGCITGQNTRETSKSQTERRLQEPQRRSNATPELADRIGTGLEGYSGDEHGEGRQGTGQSRSTTASGLSLRWPARPGEPQYEWEEPRVVDDSQSARGGRGLRKLPEEDAGIRQPQKCRQKEASESNNASEEPRVVADSQSQQGSSSDNGGEPRAASQPEQSQSGGGHSGSLRESNGQAEPQLGRATNGSTSRVDRLRLLGNGVVPLTAEKAFITLLNRVINEKR